MRNIETLTLIKCLGLNLPLIISFGYCFDKVLVLHTSLGQARYVADILSYAGETFIDSSMTMNQIKERIKYTRGAFVFYLYSQNKRADEIVALFAELATSGVIDNRKLKSVIIIIADESSLLVQRKGFFSIFLAGKLKNIDISIDDVVPEEKDIEVIKDHLIPELNTIGRCDEPALLAAATFLYPKIGDEYHSYNEMVHNLIAYNEEYGECEDIGDFFCQYFCEWIKDNHFKACQKISSYNSDIEEKILYDDAFFYITESFFDVISREIYKAIPVNALKKALKEENIIKSNKEGYTVKITLKNNVGNIIRVRMMKFIRSKFIEVGNIDFIEESEAT